MTPKTVFYMTPSVRLLGARQSLLALVRNLDRERYRPVVCCQSRGQLTDELEKDGIGVRLLETGWWRKARYWPRLPLTLFRLRNLLKQENAALIHCNEIYPNPYAVLVGRYVKIPVITHMRLSVTPEMTRKYYLDRADRIVVVSDAAGRDFNHWPNKAAKVVTIHNGVSPEQYATAQTRDEIRQDLGIAPDDFLIGLVATWAHRKRQHVAIEAMGIIARHEPKARLILVGGAAKSQADYEKELVARIEALGLQNRVIMLPFQEDIARIYHALDLNILISGDEGFGRTIIETGTIELPTIGAIAGGIPEVIRDGETGWLIPVDDPKSLADRIEHLIRNPVILKQAGIRAREFVTEKFSIQEHARKIQALYDRVLSEHEKKAKSK